MTTLTALAEGDRITFPRLQRLLDATAGNLSTHLRRLEEAGYVEVAKGHQGRVPSTQVSATRAGRRAFEDYLEALQALLTPPTDTRYPDEGGADDPDHAATRRGRPARRRRARHPAVRTRPSRWTTSP